MPHHSLLGALNILTMSVPQLHVASSQNISHSSRSCIFGFPGRRLCTSRERSFPGRWFSAEGRCISHPSPAVGVVDLRRRVVHGRNGVFCDHCFFIFMSFSVQECHSSGLSGHGLNAHVTRKTMRTTRLNDAFHTLRVVPAVSCDRGAERPLCNGTAPEKAPRRTDKSPRKAPDELHKGSRSAAGRAAEKSPQGRGLLFTSLSPLSTPSLHTTTSVAILQCQHTHCQPCRDASGRAMEFERTDSGAARRRRERRLRAWAKHERLTVAMAPRRPTGTEDGQCKWKRGAPEGAEPSPTGGRRHLCRRVGQWAFPFPLEKHDKRVPLSTAKRGSRPRRLPRAVSCTRQSPRRSSLTPSESPPLC